jgi:hypothetical protein
MEQQNLTLREAIEKLALLFSKNDNVPENGYLDKYLVHFLGFALRPKIRAGMYSQEEIQDAGFERTHDFYNILKEKTNDDFQLLFYVISYLLMCKEISHSSCKKEES